jgi:hypothetical protein
MVKDRFCNPDKLLHCSLAFIALFLVQVFAGKSGWFVADLFSYDSFDPDHLFARLSVHHIVQMLIALAVIMVLSKLIKADFGFWLRDFKKGVRYFLIFTAVIAVIALIYHILMYVLGQGLAYDFPLTKRNVLGTLGFQLFLSGTSEEILYRALPVTVLVYVFGKNISDVTEGGLYMIQGYRNESDHQVKKSGVVYIIRVHAQLLIIAVAYFIAAGSLNIGRAWLYFGVAAVTYYVS